LVERLEAGGERWAGFDGGDHAVVLPDVVEEAAEEINIGTGKPIQIEIGSTEYTYFRLSFPRE
jgi:hypothetical protein